MTIERILEGKSRAVDGLPVFRVLPDARRRAVGPFVFFDHLGPANLSPDHAMDVRPHPHIALATVTYVIEGRILHRDSLGNELMIGPGAINLMTAGRGIVHSERTPEEDRQNRAPLHCLQLWLALPKADEHTDPAFDHHPASSLPEVTHDGAKIRVLMGSAYGVTSPVKTFQETIYLECSMPAGTRYVVPETWAERAIYVVSGRGRIDDETLVPTRMAVLEAGTPVVFEAETDTMLAVLGGAPLDGPRFIEWNFVSSDAAEIERAKDDWRAGRFPKVPGDDEFIPLP